MPLDELRGHPDRVSMGVLASPTVEGVIEVEFGPTVFVVSDEQEGLADDCDDCVLVFLRQALQKSSGGMLMSTTLSPGCGLLSGTLILPRRY